MRLVDCDVTDFGDDVIFHQTSFVSGTSRFNLGDKYAPFGGQVIAVGDIGVDRLETNSHEGAGEVALLDDLLRNCLRRIYWDGEAESLGHIAHATVADHEGVDADHLTCKIHKRTTRVTMVDRRVGLDQILDGVSVAAVDGSTCRTDHTHGNGILKVS